ncbi:MAG: virulence factor [Hyphomicrobiaceae bacterium]
MADRIIVYWRDMPAQVIVKAGRKSAKRQLPERFEQAIDMAAMRAGKRDTDSYLAEWRKGEPEPVEGDDLEAIADREASRLESDYAPERMKALIANGGVEPAA